MRMIRIHVIGMHYIAADRMRLESAAVMARIVTWARIVTLGCRELSHSWHEGCIGWQESGLYFIMWDLWIGLELARLMLYIR